jgi:hypothetical protein
MISNLVSSILNPAATAVAADKAAAQQLDDDRNRPVPSAGFAARPVAARLERASVHQGGAGERIDYFHAAKKMIRDALSDFSGGVRESLADIGLDDGMAEKFTRAMVRQTKDALLWGVGFSVKLMTATVSAASEKDNEGPRPSFNIMARSIEMTVNHADGVIGVSTGNVSIESQFDGVPGARQPHLLDVRDSGDATGVDLTSALQALQDPQSLLTDIEDDAGDDNLFRLDTIQRSDNQEAIEQTLPKIDTPRVLSRPNHNSRILLSEMNHFRNERNELVTYMRLDALIPLTDKSVGAAKAAAASPPPAPIAFV